MNADARQWLQKKAGAFLERIGLRQGQTVLDFGCKVGNYTMPAARIVGEKGKVYALDKDKDSLNQLMQKAKKKRLRNIKPLHVEGDQHPPLRAGCVDAVLLYDTLHRGYLPEAAQRKRALTRIYKALRPGGLLSCYPTHLRGYGMALKKLLGEITDVGFCLEQKHRRALVHDGKLVRGAVFSFVKPAEAVSADPGSHRKHRG